MKPLLLDTGPIIAFLDRGDPHHEWVWPRFAEVSGPLVTTGAVVTEATFFLQHARNGELIGRWLKQIGLVHDFKAKPVAEGAREYRARIKVSPRSEWVSVPDVGFGISQFMPVLMQCFYAPPHSIIVIEQPELHLHPAVQQNLADLFIEVIRSREDGENRGIQLIVESHSEHFLTRLLRRIAEDKISQEEVAAYFFSQNQLGTHEAIPLEVDSYGNVRNWPPNFFGDAFGDVAARQKAGLERRQKLRNREITQ